MTIDWTTLALIAAVAPFVVIAALGVWAATTL